jgi:hypothetical protein
MGDWIKLKRVIEMYSGPFLKSSKVTSMMAGEI